MGKGGPAFRTVKALLFEGQEHADIPGGEMPDGLEPVASLGNAARGMAVRATDSCYLWWRHRQFEAVFMLYWFSNVEFLREAYKQVDGFGWHFRLRLHMQDGIPCRIQMGWQDGLCRR